MRLPTHEQALEILRAEGMPPHILAHTMQVNKIALFIARKLAEAGVQVDVNLVDVASLLHDVDKHKTFENKRHGEQARDLMASLGYPELGEIMLKHLLTKILVEKNWRIEEKIVYYADKRVNHDKIVSLEERFEYLRTRYGTNSKKLDEINACYLPCKKFEKELLEPINATSDNMNNL